MVTHASGTDREAERSAQLKALGLPVYAGRAYLALLELGTGEARQVSDLARIPPAKVYNTLEQLEQKGLAVSTPGRPRKYRPVPMEEYLARQLEEKKEALEMLEERRESLVDLFPILGTADDKTRSHISTVRGRRNISEHFRENAKSAQREIIMLLPVRPSRRIRALEKLTQDARDRGVQVRLLVPQPELDTLAQGVSATPADTRVVEPEGEDADVTLATFDGEKALLAHFVPGQPGRSFAKDLAILTAEPAFAKMLTKLLECRWDSVAPIAAAPEHRPDESDAPPLGAIGAS